MVSPRSARPGENRTRWLSGTWQGNRCGIHSRMVKIALFGIAAASLFMLSSSGLRAHDGMHMPTAETTQPGTIPIGVSAATGKDDLPVTLDQDVGLHLRDQFGHPFTDDDLRGRRSLVFFGYARCEGICPQALPLMAEAARLLEEDGKSVQLVLITIDDEHDDPQTLRTWLAELHPEFRGLTGGASALADARQKFHVRRSLAMENDDGPIYRHGTFIYHVGPNLELSGLLPPMLSPEKLAGILDGYL
ncbi:MAG: SCO family protein [Geminicoccaceae bacterium]